MSEHNEWLCCLCNAGRSACNCLRLHKLAGFSLVGIAIFLGLLNIGLWSFVSIDSGYQDQVFENWVDLAPY